MLCCQAKPSSAGKSRPRIRERPDQVSPRQAGRERERGGRGGEGERGRYEVREERGIETGRKNERADQVSPRLPE